MKLINVKQMKLMGHIPGRSSKFCEGGWTVNIYHAYYNLSGEYIVGNQKITYKGIFPKNLFNWYSIPIVSKWKEMEEYLIREHKLEVASDYSPGS